MKSPVDDQIAFSIKLNEVSEPFYRMDSVSGVLKGHEQKQIQLSIFSRSDITVSRWGNIKPEIILTVNYTHRSKDYVIHGGALEYWPGGDY